MSILISLFLFFLCVSMHACDARHFGVLNKDSVSTQLQFSSEKVNVFDLNSVEGGTNKGYGNVDKSNYHSSAITHEESKDDSKIISSGHVSVSWHVPVKNQAGKPPGVFSDYSQPRTRSEIFSSSHVRLLKATNTEGSKRRALLLLGSDTDATEGIESNNNKAHDHQEEEKDVAAVVMDYEPPHQTPPIHNGQT